MTVLPQVLVGGYPRSGTSMLCQIVSGLGFSAGSRKALKPPNGRNPRGYWEFIPMRSLLWQDVGIGRTINTQDPAAYPAEAPDITPQVWQKVARLAYKHGIEVYKDTYLPLVWHAFPAESAYIIIKRDWHATWLSNYRRPDMEIFKQCYVKYHRLVDQMRLRVRLLQIDYEAFATDFEAACKRVAIFLNVPYKSPPVWFEPNEGYMQASPDWKQKDGKWQPSS